MRKKLKGFTLIEMLIVIVIIGILAVVLTESYISISRIALKIEQEKNLSEESLVLTQIFQSISDEATIDYEKYSENHIDLVKSEWMSDILYLTWEQRSWTSIYTTGENCLNIDWNFMPNDDGTFPDYSEKVRNALTWCSLVLEQNWEIINLAMQWKVIVSEVKFRIIPYDKYDNYFANENWEIIINDIHQPAFRIFIHLYAPLYQPKWMNKIDQSLQLFFNLKA